MSEIKITQSNFEDEVIKSDKPVLLDFWATWCGPCKMIAPIVEEIAKEQEGIIKVGKVNVDDEPELSSAFHIASIPTLLVIKNGKVTSSKIGYCSKDVILGMLK